MKFTAAATLAALLGSASAGSRSNERTFAVLRFNGKELVKGRMDPIVNPGGTAGHVHSIFGGSNFGISATGQSMMNSQCSNAKIKGDNSAYWFPSLYFKDPATGQLEPVEIFYVNVYYFFEPTDDDIKAFPVGLQMLTGNAGTRSPPAGGGGENLDPDRGPIQNIQFTCPRSAYNPPSYPPGSDGTRGGMQDPQNTQAGAGFPFQNCDGYASPLRADIHFPSCYNPAAGLTNYKENMAWPSGKGASDSRRRNCPPGWIHVPHIFFETYWDTPKFKDRWTPGNSQPFVLSNGDATGYSSHGDFLAAWDENVLQHIIDTCNAGSAGMDLCPGVQLNQGTCTIPSQINEVIGGVLDKLPGNNPISGWEYGAAAPGSGAGSGAPPGSGAGSGAPPGYVAPIQDPAPNTEKPAANPPKVESPAPSPQEDDYGYGAPAPAPATPEPTPAPVAEVKPKKCELKVETVWETVTVYDTTTETVPKSQATKAADDSYKMRRHVHQHANHALRHRSPRN